MTIRTLILSVVAVFVIVTGVMTAVFYQYERKAVVEYIANAVQQSVYRLEEGLKEALQNHEEHKIQSLLDTEAAIDLSIEKIALSTDGRTIIYSSKRSEIGKPVQGMYAPIENLVQELSASSESPFKSEFYYFHLDHKHTVEVLVHLDREYVYGQLNRLAWLYGFVLLILLIMVVALVLVGVKRFMVLPLEELIKMAESKERKARHYFIEELSLLSHTLAVTFRNMWLQHEKLQDALDESHYLDGILRTVADVNGHLISSKNVEELIQKCCQRISEHPGYGICWIGLIENGILEVRGLTNDPTGFLHLGLKINMETEEGGSFAPSIQAYTNNEKVVLTHLEQHESLAPWSFIAKEVGYGSFISMPLISSQQEKPFGVLNLYAQESDGFRKKESEMLQELAGDIGFAIFAYMQRDEFERHLSIDTTTGLANRVSLIDYLSDHRISSLAIVNIDRFSDINDVYGVAIGDHILAGYGYWLSKKIEKREGVRLYKLGIDEYALVFSDYTAMENNIIFLEYLIDKTEEESFIIDGIEVILTISIGFDPQSDKLLENATRALKQAKLEHKKMHIYSPVIGEQKEQENNIAWYKEIKEALEEDRIVPYFQPIVDNKTYQIIKYEALIRLIKQDGTVVTPIHFLEIAKKIRLYPLLTKVMVDKVLQRFETMHIPVSINLSTEDILNAELASYIEESIMQSQIGKLIIFEILESEGITNYNEVSAFIERFKAIGCSFAIDDFGAGYSNFEHLLKLNVDTLKIDGSLIKNLPHDHNAQIIVRHIRNFANEMGFSTVAEFVANEAIYEKVLEYGIDASQGYHFYEPSDLLER